MKIATLTLNPSLDKSTTVERLLASEKLRCKAAVYEPGGGGVNVSRAIKILGGESLAIYLAGGKTGNQIQELLTAQGIAQKVIHGNQATRENFMVVETSTNHQYRFGMPGAYATEEELELCLQAISELPDEVEYLVASGSLPPGAPDDFFGKVVSITKSKNIECIVDTSGTALLKAAEMGVCLMKPNLSELSNLAGKDHISAMEQEDIAKSVIKKGKAKMLVVSLGPRGAMMATENSIKYVVPPTVKQSSTVGAGDCMVAAMVMSLARKENLGEVLKWGIAAGTAATMTPGTQLCLKKDVMEIYNWLSKMEKEGH